MPKTHSERQLEYERRSHYAAQTRYRQKAVYRPAIAFNRNTEPDIVEYLSGIENKTDYIRQLIRADMEKNR